MEKWGGEGASLAEREKGLRDREIRLHQEENELIRREEAMMARHGAMTEQDRRLQEKQRGLLAGERAHWGEQELLQRGIREMKPLVAGEYQETAQESRQAAMDLRERALAARAEALRVREQELMEGDLRVQRAEAELQKREIEIVKMEQTLGEYQEALAPREPVAPRPTKVPTYSGVPVPPDAWGQPASRPSKQTWPWGQSSPAQAPVQPRPWPSPPSVPGPPPKAAEPWSQAPPAVRVPGGVVLSPFQEVPTDSVVFTLTKKIDREPPRPVSPGRWPGPPRPLTRPAEPKGPDEAPPPPPPVKAPPPSPPAKAAVPPPPPMEPPVQSWVEEIQSLALETRSGSIPSPLSSAEAKGAPPLRPPPIPTDTALLAKTITVTLTRDGETNFFVDGRGDISEGGIFLVTFDLLPLGVQVAIDCTLPGGYHFTRGGKVAWLREFDHEAPEVNPGMGIRLRGLISRDIEEINRFFRIKRPLVHRA